MPLQQTLENGLALLRAGELRNKDGSLVDGAPDQRPPEARCAASEGSDLDALTMYILQSARTYSTGAWSGVDVAEDMLRSAGITRAEIERFTADTYERRKLCALLRPNTKISNSGA